MVNKILESAGFVLNETYRETRFLTPPQATYAVYNDEQVARGADAYISIVEHSVTIELYECTPDKDAEKRIEAVLASLNLEYTKQSRYWIQDEQLYQVIYEFDYIEKKGVN